MNPLNPMNYPDWSKVARFNFTWAIPGGAWLEWDTEPGKEPYRNWFAWSTIRHHLGQTWIDAQLKRQGWMTGCWVGVTSREPASK